MGQETATVETLTAEVRVLMVGSRQITLSVARQLEWVGLPMVEPFGRVNLGDKWHDQAVIGRDVEDGALVLAKFQWPYGRREAPWIDSEDLNGGEIVLCSHCSRLDRDGCVKLDWDGRTIDAFENCIYDKEQLCECECEFYMPRRSKEMHEQNKCTKPWSATREVKKLVNSRIDESYQDYSERFDRNKRASELPLIVLAGLR